MVPALLDVTPKSDPFIGLILSVAVLVVRIYEFRNAFLWKEPGMLVALKVRETYVSTVSEI